AEMKERVSALVGPRAAAMWVSTFHSMCVRLLRREAKQLQRLVEAGGRSEAVGEGEPRLNSNFSVYDADDSRRLITLVARELDLDPKRYPARSLAAQISNLKNELIDPVTAADRATNDLERRVAEVYAAYQQRLALANALDF